MAVDWIKVIADDQRLFHEGPIGVLERLSGWGSGAQPPETTRQPAGYTAYVQWAHLARDATGASGALSASDASRPWTDPRPRIGNNEPNSRVHLRHRQMLWLLNDGTWLVDEYSDRINRVMFPFSWSEGQDFNMPSPQFRDEGGGILGGSSIQGIGLTGGPYRDNLWHPYGTRRRIPLNYVGVLSVFFGRLIPDNASAPWNPALINILMACSWDWYLALSLSSPPQQGVNVLYGGYSRFKYLRPAWQLFASTNLTEAQLRANPPPLVGLDLLDATIVTPPVVTPPVVTPPGEPPAGTLPLRTPLIGSYFPKLTGGENSYAVMNATAPAAGIPRRARRARTMF